MACWLSCILTYSSCSFSCSLFCLHLLYISTIWYTRIPFNWSLDVKLYDIILYYNPVNWLIGWTDKDLDVVCVCVCGADAAADRRLNVRMEAWTKKWTDGEADRPPDASSRWLLFYWPCDWSIRCSVWNIISRYQVVPSCLQKQKQKKAPATYLSRTVNACM